MEMLKLLIADDNEEFSHALSDALQSTYRIRSCRTGREALALLRSFLPDVLVVNLMIPEMDGISLLENAIRIGIRPMVLATTRWDNDYVVESATRLGVGYLMRRPCDIPSTVDRIRDLSRRLEPSLIAPDPLNYVSNILLSLSIPPRLDGYAMARDAILIQAGRPKMSITKELYPIVAASHGCKRDSVERCIRNAIKIAWNNRNESVWRMYFQPQADGTLRRPSNGTFITQLANSLQLNRNTLTEIREAAEDPPRSGTY